MVGMRLLVNTGSGKDIVIIEKVLYTEKKDTYSLECKSLCRNTKVNLIMTVNQIKNSLVK